jgi:hypothetical protein
MAKKRLIWDPNKVGVCSACNGTGRRTVISGKDEKGRDTYETVDCPRTMVTGGYVEVDDD